jgi:hypothetical protein
MSPPARPNAKSLAELIAGALDPLVRKRGLARAELIAWWPDIVGPAYAGRTVPERIRWPRDGNAATLFVRCDPSLALQLAHETDRMRERLNGYFGYAAVGAVRIVQGAVGPKAEAPAPDGEPRDLPPATQRRLDAVEGPLADSLRELGRQILAREERFPHIIAGS